MSKERPAVPVVAPDMTRGAKMVTMGGIFIAIAGRLTLRGRLNRPPKVGVEQSGISFDSTMTILGSTACVDGPSHPGEGPQTKPAEQENAHHPGMPCRSSTEHGSALLGRWTDRDHRSGVAACEGLR